MLFIGNVFAAEEPATVYIDGEEADFTVSVLSLDGHIFVPLRPVFEAYRINVSWDAKRKSVRALTQMGNLVIRIGSNYVCQNDHVVYWLDAYPRIYQGATMIPMKFAGDCLGVDITYVDSTNSLSLSAR